MVVEDEVRLARNIARALELDKYNVSIAHNGLEAESLMSEGHFDLVIMDIMMPEQDGLTTLENMRKSNSSLPVLMLTALGQLEDKIAGLDAGADDYLAKPFELDEVLARVRALLRRRETAVQEQLSCGSLVLDRGTKQATRAGQMVKLSATEYRLLEFMMLHAGEVQSETDLLEHVWDRNYDGMSNMVAVYVGYVRNKIDKKFPKETALIETVRGLGYRIQDN